MSVSAGVSVSDSTSLASKMATGAKTFGAVNIDQSQSKNKTPIWVWIGLAVSILTLVLMLKRK